MTATWQQQRDDELARGDPIAQGLDEPLGEDCGNQECDCECHDILGCDCAYPSGDNRWKCAHADCAEGDCQQADGGDDS